MNTPQMAFGGLLKMNFRYNRPTYVLAEADPEKQTTFQEDLERIRVGELSALNIEDVDLEEGWVHVREGKGRDRQVPISKAALDDLKQ